MFLILTFLCEQCSITIIAFNGKSEYEMIPESVVYLMPWKGWNKVNVNQRYMYIACCSSVYVPTHLVSVFIINFPLVSLN